MGPTYRSEGKKILFLTNTQSWHNRIPFRCKKTCSFIFGFSYVRRLFTKSSWPFFGQRTITGPGPSLFFIYNGDSKAPDSLSLTQNVTKILKGKDILKIHKYMYQFGRFLCGFFEFRLQIDLDFSTRNYNFYTVSDFVSSLRGLFFGTSVRRSVNYKS